MLKELTENDRMALIKFESVSEIVCGLEKMTEANKILLDKGIKSLESRGGTRIAAGIESALNVIKTRSTMAPITGILLLSDG